MPRKPSKKQQIKELLSDYQPHESTELIPITHRFSDVISRLREDGYLIETIPISHHQYAYQMHSEGSSHQKAA